MSNEPLNFEEHLRRRHADAEVVPCAKCKKRIPALSTRCPECGISFSGRQRTSRRTVGAVAARRRGR